MKKPQDTLPSNDDMPNDVKSHLLISATILFLIAQGFLGGQGSFAASPPVISLAIDPGAVSIVACSQAGVAVHRISDLSYQRDIPTELETPHDAAFSPEGKILAIGGGTPSENGSIELYDWPTGKRLRTLDAHDDSVMAISWIGETRLASVGLDHRVLVWDLTTGEVTHRLDGHSRGVVTVCVLPAQQLLVTAGLDQNIRVWSLPSGEQKRGMSIHVKPITAVATRPTQDGLPMIASASDDGTVRFWQPTIGRMVRFARLPSRPRDIAWLTDGSKVIACCDDGRAYLIDPDTIDVSEPIEAIDAWAYCIAVHPSEPEVFVGGSKGALRRIVNPSPN